MTDSHRAEALDPVEVGVLDREDPRRREDLRTASGRTHRVGPDFGPALTISSRDSQSNRWVDWKITGQPCEFQVAVSERRR